MEFLAAVFVIGLVGAFVYFLTIVHRANADTDRQPLDGLPRSPYRKLLASDFEATLGALGRVAGKTTGGVARSAQSAYRAANPTVASNSKTSTESLAKYEALEKLQALLDKGTLSRDEFETEKKNLLR